MTEADWCGLHKKVVTTNDCFVCEKLSYHGGGAVLNTLLRDKLKTKPEHAWVELRCDYYRPRTRSHYIQMLYPECKLLTDDA